MSNTSENLNTQDRNRLTWQVTTILTLWLGAVVVGAATGALGRLYMPLIAAIVATTIALPTLWYFVSPQFRAFIEGIGHRRIMLLHIWRIPAALLFFWYGFQGELPPVFWILAGIGDFIAGSYALYLASKPESPAHYLSFHRFGFADFAVAVATGLTFTLLQDPRIALIATLPMALIPLFGVGISGATHLMAFDMLKRGAGFPNAAPDSDQASSHILAQY
jgi:hypothetical protein